VSGNFDPGALMARVYTLPRGPRVCLRLVRIRDRDGIEDLLRRQGHTLSGWELAQLLRGDPRQRIILCATALLNSSETVLGVGRIELGPAGPGPAWVIVDEDVTDGLAPLITHALTGRAEALARTRAA
jgi:hypothetical protein